MAQMTTLEPARATPLPYSLNTRFGGTAAAAAIPIVTQIISAARRRKWIIGGSIAACLILGLLVTLLTTPKYTVTAVLEIQRENSNLANISEADPRMASVDQEFYETQYGLLQSRNLSERVASSLRLQDNAAFFKSFGTGEAWFKDGQPIAGISTRDQRIRAAGSILLDHMKLNHERQSRLVEIEFTGPDPVLGQRIVAAWATTFVQMTLERRFDSSSYARTFLENRLAQLRERIDASERRLVDYASREGIVNLPGSQGAAGQPSSPERSLAADDLATLNAEHAQATADRIRAQTRLGAPGAQTTESLQSAALNQLREQRASLQADYAKMMVQFAPDYPPARALANQIAQMDRSIAREEARISGLLQKTYDAAASRERELNAQVNQLKNSVLDLRRRSIQYNIYQRDADTNRQLYDALLQRYKQIGVAGGVAASNISVVDMPEVPTTPSSPKLLFNMALALFAGVMLGTGLAWLLEQLNQGITDPDEISSDLGLPLLGTIPREPNAHPLEALADRKSGVSEAYVSIQTSLAFSTDHGIPRTLAVMSTKSSEGKSTTSLALAQSFARSKMRVLLIDGDMRSPSVDTLLRISNNVGLSNYLSGDDNLEALLQHTGIDNLTAMTTGPQPPSSPELLSSKRFSQLLDLLGSQFDNIIIDSPPVMGLADAPLIGNKTEGVVYVIEANATHKNMARVALSRLKAANVHIMGVVLTKFDARVAHYGQGYEYGYGYGYGQKS